VRRLIVGKAITGIPVSEEEDRRQNHQYSNEREYGYRHPPIPRGEREVTSHISKIVDPEGQTRPFRPR